MAAISGYSGSVNGIGNLDEWQIDIKRDNFDISSFNQEGGWKDNLNGMAEWSGSCKGNFDLGAGQSTFQDAVLTGNTISLTLETGTATGAVESSGGASYSGKANITDFTVKTPVNNKVDVTIKFKGKGKLQAG